MKTKKNYADSDNVLTVERIGNYVFKQFDPDAISRRQHSSRLILMDHFESVFSSITCCNVFERWHTRPYFKDVADSEDVYSKVIQFWEKHPNILISDWVNGQPELILTKNKKEWVISDLSPDRFGLSESNRWLILDFSLEEQSDVSK